MQTLFVRSLLCPSLVAFTLASGILSMPQRGFAAGPQDAPAAESPAAAVSSQAAPSKPAPTALEIQTAIDRGISFLRLRGQGDDGSFSPQTGAAVTGLCVRAIIQNRPKAVREAYIEKAMKYLEGKIQPDGGIYQTGSLYKNYETSVALGAMIQANDGHQYDSVMLKGEAFLKKIQWDEGEGVGPADAAYGGAGYGSHERPDLSNTTFFIDTLHELGRGPEDEAIKKALQFVSRTQNLSGHGNDTEHADKIGDGGFYYTPAAGGQSKAEDLGSGGLRSYGSMTYAGFKSMIYAGLTPEDPRVLAALTFIQKNYALDTNPGIGKAGLYYYYHTFAKALDAAKIDTLDDASGTPHVWREELSRTLIDAQQEDGAWVNRDNSRWLEGDRQLVTAYALLALSYCQEQN